MNDLGKTKYCLGLQLEHIPTFRTSIDLCRESIGEIQYG
jgi:hypothetical protein